MEAHSCSTKIPFSAPMSLEECLELQRQLPHLRFEYINGIAYEMPGATRKHENIASDLFAEFVKKLEKSLCQVYASGLALEFEDREGYFFPDIMIECPPGTEDSARHPVFLAEVLSPSTQAYDLRTKKEVYLSIRSLRHLLFIDPKAVYIEHYSRTDESDLWQFECLRNLDAELYLAHWDIRLSVRAIYRHVITE